MIYDKLTFKQGMFPSNTQNQGRSMVQSPHFIDEKDHLYVKTHLPYAIFDLTQRKSRKELHLKSLRLFVITFFTKSFNERQLR